MDLYDIERDKWYFQSTSTDADYPLKTLSGCVAVGSDERTWEIYMHGSIEQRFVDSIEYASRQDIWVLTIPAFHWFRIPADHNRKALVGHQCHIVGKQLVTVSGHEVDGADWNTTAQEASCMNSPFRVFDLEQLKVGYPSFSPPPPPLQGERCT